MIEKNTEEMNEILLLLRKYLVLPKKLIYRFMQPMDPSKVDKTLHQLIRSQYLFTDASKEMIGIRRNFMITPLMEKQHNALEVILLFRKHLKYHAPMDFPSTLYFLLEEHECEVLVVLEGDEMIMNKLYAQRTESEMKRFVFVEKEEQIPLLHIPNVALFCRRNHEGKIQKYVQEDL